MRNRWHVPSAALSRGAPRVVPTLTLPRCATRNPGGARARASVPEHATAHLGHPIADATEGALHMVPLEPLETWEANWWTQHG